jgi:hypothetical protein
LLRLEPRCRHNPTKKFSAICRFKTMEAIMRFIRAFFIACSLILAASATPNLTAPVFAQAKLIDINSAPKTDLEALKGVGPARADAIIKGRPYKGKDELVQKKIVPQNVYNDIKDKIIARQKR